MLGGVGAGEGDLPGYPIRPFLFSNNLRVCPADMSHNPYAADLVSDDLTVNSMGA